MTPILYSFRRCPYAMRARLALASAQIEVELREILLRDKPPHMLEKSPKGTVPVLLVGEDVVDESWDIMNWALDRNDPDGWREMPKAGEDWIAAIEGPFKSALDRYKYETRYTGVVAHEERDKAAKILMEIEPNLAKTPWIYGEKPTLADMATITFVRQYAMTDKAWFDAQNWPGVQGWLERFLQSARFKGMMHKYQVWSEGDAPVYFGATKSHI